MSNAKFAFSIMASCALRSALWALLAESLEANAHWWARAALPVPAEGGLLRSCFA